MPLPFLQELSTEIKNQAIAAAELNRECLGIVSRNDIFALDNIHLDAADFVLIDPSILSGFERSQIQLIYHSHWKDSHSGELTPSDCWMAHHYGVPFLLYHVGFDSWDYYEPKNPNPWPLKAIAKEGNEFYLGWRSCFQRSDCFSLVYRYFLRELNADINEWQRTDNFGTPQFKSPWRAEDNGFVILPPGTTPQKHDIFGIAPNGGKEYSHAAVFVNEEHNLILHSPSFKSVSQVVPFGHYWRSRMVAHGRHKLLAG